MKPRSKTDSNLRPWKGRKWSTVFILLACVSWSGFAVSTVLTLSEPAPGVQYYFGDGPALLKARLVASATMLNQPLRRIWRDAKQKRSRGEALDKVINLAGPDDRGAFFRCLHARKMKG